MSNKNESHHSGSYMVRRNLHAIVKYASMLMDMIGEHDEVESWMEHKISIAKAAVSDVKDAMMYDQEEGDEDHEDHDDHKDHNPHMKIAVLKGVAQPHDEFGLNKIMGGCGGANEGKIFVGSGAINENKQLVAGANQKKYLVESAERIGNLIRITTKNGATHEYSPYCGAELEMMRCEQYGIPVK
jgi:hypothetical protein